VLRRESRYTENVLQREGAESEEDPSQGFIRGTATSGPINREAELERKMPMTLENDFLKKPCSGRGTTAAGNQVEEGTLREDPREVESRARLSVFQILAPGEPGRLLPVRHREEVWN